SPALILAWAETFEAGLAVSTPGSVTSARVGTPGLVQSPTCTVSRSSDYGRSQGERMASDMTNRYAAAITACSSVVISCASDGWRDWKPPMSRRARATRPNTRQGSRICRSDASAARTCLPWSWALPAGARSIEPDARSGSLSSADPDDDTKGLPVHPAV